jgi:two-component SAPR family response regulator
MQIKIKYLLLLILLLAGSLQARSDDEIKRGLYFRSFEVDKDQRTCLNLAPDRPLVFNKGFSMEFDIQLRREYQSFGYVFRIVGNDTLNMDFLANITSGDANFSLVIKNKAALQFKNPEIGESVENRWIKASFVFDPAGQTVSVSLDGVRKETICPLDGLKHFKIYFGGNTHDVFSTTDVVPMLVKDIRFFDEKKKPVRHWELAKHSFDCVYDECISDKATVQNPVWKIDRHAKWNKRKTLVCAGQNQQIAFDRKGDRIYFAEDTALFIYDFKEKRMDTVRVLARVPFSNDRSNQVIYDPNRQVLISYYFEDRKLAVFDFSTRKWNSDDSPIVITQKYSHHSRVFIENDNLLVTFGGYGHHRYNSIFHKCRVVENTWEEADLSQSIPPRYLGGMGCMENRSLLYFGGFGNESGIQEESPHNYYDLYTIDIDTETVKKIWELPHPQEHFTNSNSLVVDKDNGKFYALAYPNKRYASVIKLHKYSLDKPEYHVVGDSIPYFFNDVESYCDLFQSSDGSELYAVTSYARGNSSDINIYAIAFPPLSPEEVVQQPPLRSNTRLWLLLLALFAGLVPALAIYRKRRSRLPGSDEPIPDKEKEEEPVVYKSLFAEKKPSSIYLLGHFYVIDSDGNDITKNLTPTTTRLFLLLLMSTVRNGRGITSSELQKILWFDKDDDSARNNRGVYINKLRSILKSFTEIRVVKHEGYWSIQSGKNVFCDYERVLALMKIIPSDRFHIKLLTELVDIALKGALLPHLQPEEWLDSYQSDYANRLIECLMEYSKRDKVKTDLLLLLKIADVILLHDNIDEDAIKLKCYILFRSGRKNQAVQAFNKFTADYEDLLAAKHNLVFDDLVKSI